MSCECKENKKRNYYRYYDTPDGCDVDKKVMVTARYGAMAGMVLSTFDVLMFSHAVGVGPILRRFAFHMGHPALMGATFALVANGVQHWRQKDDSLNYFFGNVGGIVSLGLAYVFEVRGAGLRSDLSVVLGLEARGTARWDRSGTGRLSEEGRHRQPLDPVSARPVAQGHRQLLEERLHPHQGSTRRHATYLRQEDMLELTSTTNVMFSLHDIMK